MKCDKRVFESKNAYQHLEEQDTVLTVSGEKEKVEEAYQRSLEILEEELAKIEVSK